MKEPILTIVTRHMVGKRTKQLERLQGSLSIVRQDMSQNLIIPDSVQAGLYESAKLMVAQKEEAKGYYVWILDDDDICSYPALPYHLETIRQDYDSDVIVVKHLIRKFEGTEHILPEEKIWVERNFQGFVRGNIGCPGFIVKNWIYKEFIHHFAINIKSCLDWHYLAAVRDAILKDGLSTYWLDAIAMEVPKKGGGQ